VGLNLVDMDLNGKLKELRSRPIRCKRCSASDVWRVRSHNEIVFSQIWHKGLKPFQCRACGYRFYHHARRRTDSLPSFNQIRPRLTNTRPARIALVTAMIVVVVTLLLAGRQWWRMSHTSHAGPLAVPRVSLSPVRGVQYPLSATFCETGGAVRAKPARC
jgi:hypothetical protein